MALPVSKDTLTQKYVVEKKPMHMVAKELGISVGTAYNYIHKYGIDARDKNQYDRTAKQREHSRLLGQSRKGKPHSQEAKEKMSRAKSGKFVAPSKFGGHTKKRSDGYIAVYAPGHPCCNLEGYVMEHRLVMEESIGRYLADGEVVHHINGKRNDNRIENLKLMTASEHMSYHSSNRHKNRKGK